ncbi:MAG: TolC family protein [Rhodobacteraceae bacterium]|nr:TolC family protein [Paracoccaceae bacterium]
MRYETPARPEGVPPAPLARGLFLSVFLVLATACTAPPPHGVTPAQGPAPADTAPADGISPPPATRDRAPVPLPLLRPGTAAERLARAALAESDRDSPSRDLLVQRQQERVATERRRWPLIAPVARVNQDGEAEAGVRATLVLHDFGRSRAQQARADSAITLAQLDLWRERIDSTQAVLGHIVDAGAALALRDASAASMTDIEALRQIALNRVESGIADQLELALFDLRLAQLRDEIAADTALLNLALGQIASATGRPEVTAPSLAEFAAAFRPAPETGIGVADTAPALLRAQLNQTRAEQDLALATARRLPAVQLRGTVTGGDESSSQVALELETSDFPGFATRPALLAARTSLSSARAAVARTIREEEAEANRVALEHARLDSRMASLTQLEAEARASVALFLEQQELGDRPLTDGITVYRTVLGAQRDLIQVRANMLRLRIGDAARTGLLVGWDGAE